MPFLVKLFSPQHPIIVGMQSIADSWSKQIKQIQESQFKKNINSPDRVVSMPSMNSFWANEFTLTPVNRTAVNVIRQ
jgi:hypothetical protein